MKKMITYLLLIALIGALAGCGLAAREIKLKSQSEKKDVFSEVTGEGLPPEGFADVAIKTSIKTHLEGFYFMEPENSLHGKEGYPVLINIDGQAVIWKLKGEEEIIPDEKGYNREEGEGMRYKLNKRIRLTRGPHTIFFGLPGEKIYKEISLTFIEGSVNVLEFKPSYHTRRGRTTRSFLQGMDGGEMNFNGNRIP